MAQISGNINAEGIISNNAGSLGTQINDTITITEFKNKNNNLNILRILQKRINGGTSWNSASTRIQQITDITNQGYIEFNPPNNNYGIALGTHQGEKITITQNGNIGIGITTPIYKLDVNGNINLTGNLYKNGSAISFNNGISLLNDETFIDNHNEKLQEKNNIFNIIKNGCSSVNFQLNVNYYTGSGSFITLDTTDLQYGLFMTAAHCVMVNNVVVSQFVLTNPITGNFEFIDVNNIYWDGIGDIALIRTNINFTNYSSYPLKLASINSNTGDTCILCGNPAGVDNKSYAKGVIRDSQYYENSGYQIPESLLIDTSGIGGNSGSPILNYKGEIIGIFTFAFTNYETLGGGSNLSVLNRTLPVLKNLAITNSDTKRFTTKYFIGIGYYTPSTFPFILKQNIYNTNIFPNQGILIDRVNLLSPFTYILFPNDILLSVIINSIEYPFGVSLGQFCPGIIIYQQNPNISIKYLDQSENYIQKIVPIDLTTYIYANVSADYDLPLNTAFSTETSENYKERMQSRLVFLRDKK